MAIPLLTIEDIFKPKVYVNIREFMQPAIHFLKHGCYTKAPKNHRDYKEFWDEETNRCLNGYQVGDLWITGKHYFYLNYIPIKKIPDRIYLEINPNAPKNRKVLSFPSFWDIDMKWWYTKELVSQKAERGDPDCHIACLKTRRAGFSFKEACEGVYNYTFVANSMSTYFASTNEYLIKDAIFNKVGSMLDFLNKHTAWRQRRTPDNKFHKRACWIDKAGNERGRKAELIAQVLDDPDKARGGDALKITFEEAGSFKGLLTAWEIILPQVTQSGIVSGFMTAFGTGGEGNEHAAEGLEELFYNPSSYDCISFPNIWDENLEGTESGFFVPSYMINHKHMDDDGNINEEAAIQETTEVRDRRKGSKKFGQYICENPISPEEALRRPSTNVMPVKELRDHRRKLESDKTIMGNVLTGWVEQVSKEGVVLGAEFKLTNDVPFTDYPVKLGEEKSKLKSAVCIVEMPYRDQVGKVPDGMYFITVDPYYKDEAQYSESIGSINVFKRSNTIDNSTYNKHVAWWDGRIPKEDFNRLLFDIASLYNAQIQSEIRGGGQDIVGYARRKGLLHRLHYEPIYDIKKEQFTQYKNRSFFVNVDKDKRKLMASNLADWLTTPIGVGEHGYILNLHKIYNPALCKELERFRYDGNFDRADSFMLGIMMFKELEVVEIKAREEDNSFFSRDLFSSTSKPSSNKPTLNIKGAINFSDSERGGTLDSY